MMIRTFMLPLILTAGIALAAPAMAADQAAPSANAEAGDQAAQQQHIPASSAPVNGAAPAAISNTEAAGLAPVGGSATVGQTGTPAQSDAGGHTGNGGEAARNHMDTGSQLVHHDWPFDGVFGTYDHAALQRGFQVYKQVCSACHSLNLLSYRNLEDIGYSEGQVKAIAAQAQVDDIGDDGSVIQRPGKPSDRFHAPFANKKAAQAANNGAAPPDMSLLVNAREGGSDYIYSILTGYTKAPAGVTLLPGQYYNTAIVGHIIAMPPPLTTDGQVSYDGFTVASTKDQNARDVAQFLMWASNPHLEQRKRTGVAVLIFLVILAGVSYAYKRRVWKDVHH